MALYNVTYNESQTGNQITEVISRNSIEDLIRYLDLIGATNVSIVKFDIHVYRELRGIGLTHDQCDRVLELMEKIKKYLENIDNVK